MSNTTKPVNQTQEALLSVPAIKPYQLVHEGTGEVVSRYKYLEGHPRQYRFDAKEGVFNINGVEKLGRTMTFQPIAWRIFTDDIFKMGVKNWAEFFFIDEKNCISAVAFHGYSVDNVFKLIEPLYYDDLTLADIVLTVVAEKKENTKIETKGIYYIASFSYKMADPAKVAEYKSLTTDCKIFRSDSLTDLANVKTAHGFYNPHAHAIDEPTTTGLPSGETVALPVGSEPQ